VDSPYFLFLIIYSKLKIFKNEKNGKNGENGVSYLFYLGGCIRKKVRNLFKIIFERNKKGS
jgi:hypothetical protein